MELVRPSCPLCLSRLHLWSVPGVLLRFPPFLVERFLLPNDATSNEHRCFSKRTLPHPSPPDHIHFLLGPSEYLMPTNDRDLSRSLAPNVFIRFVFPLPGRRGYSLGQGTKIDDLLWSTMHVGLVIPWVGPTQKPEAH